jgi:hypothetical protein
MKISVLVLLGLLGLGFATLGCAGVARAAANESAPTVPKPVESRGWRAWLNKMPPRPTSLHVLGEVLMAGGGAKLQLTRATPQGFNPNVLLLELALTDQQSAAPTESRWVEVRFDETSAGVDYTEVDIRYRGELLQRLKVDVAY